MIRNADSRWRSLADWRAWTLILGTLLAYSEVIQYEFVNFDDDVHIFENGHVRTGLSWENAKWAFTIHGPSQWHPLAWLSHQLDCQLFGLDPGWHHATNLLLHVIGAVLLYVALRELCGRPNAALFVAAMFALHPLNVESVAWVSERRNVLCGVFWMCTLIAYARYVRRGGAMRYVAVLAAFAAALMSKPMAVVLPCVLLLLDYWPLRRWLLDSTHDDESAQPTDRKRRTAAVFVEKVPLFALAAIAGWLSYRCQQSIKVVWSFEDISLVDRIENAIVSYGLYLRRMVFPFDLAVLYPHPALSGAGETGHTYLPAIVSGCVLVIVTGIALLLRRSRPALLVGWLWFLGTLVPMIGLVQVGEQQMADRYVYVAMIGLGIAAAYAVRKPTTPSRSRTCWAVATIAIIGWGAVTWHQLGYWSDSATLFTRTINVTRDNSRARLNLGMAMYQQGNITEAVVHYQESLRIDPEFGLAWYNLGIAYQDMQQLVPALHCFEQAVFHNPQDTDFRLRLGGARGQSGDLPGAIREFEQVLQLDPNSVMASINLGVAFETLGQLDSAIISLQRAVDLAPANEKAQTLLASALERRRRETSQQPGPATP